MARLTKDTLLRNIVGALASAGWHVEVLTERRVHPMLVSLRRGRDTHRLRIYVWNLTHGGGSARPKHEYRIQVTGGVTKFERMTGEHTLILGWSEEYGVFAAFDYERHAQPLGSSPSLQISNTALLTGQQQGIAAREKGNKEVSIAARADFLSDYISNHAALHNAAQTQQVVDQIRAKHFMASSDNETESQIASSLNRLSVESPSALGSPSEIAQRAVVVERLNRLERELEALRQRPGMMGHNLPPDDQKIDNEQEILDATRDIRAELDKPKPVVKTVAERGRFLARIAGLWRTVKDESKKTTKLAADKVRERAVEATIGATVTGGSLFHNEIASTVHAAASSVATWLTFIFG